jgi:hypothetical protein
MFGKWLQLSFNKFQREKEGGNQALTTFGSWLETNCNVKERWARELRNVNILCDRYPQLLVCYDPPVSFFIRHGNLIKSYFETNKNVGERWAKHRRKLPVPDSLSHEVEKMLEPIRCLP